MNNPRVFSANAYISHAGNFDKAVQIVTHGMARKLAHEIAKNKVLHTRGEFSTRYQLDVIVVTPDEFFRAVEDCARRLKYGAPEVLFSNDGVTT